MVLVMGAAIVREGRVLVARRTSPPDLAGGWEFPGGKVEPGEDAEQAIVREIAEELGCRIEVTGHLGGEASIREGYTLRVALARLSEGEPTPREDEHDAVRWLQPEELDAVRWLGPDRPFLAELREILLDGHPLEGGNVGVTVRIGGTVRRATGPWTPAVHALLDHLAERGMPGVPRVLGTDDRGREILTYLPGRIVDVDRELLSDGQLASLVSWTRRLHHEAAGFEHPGPWRFPAARSAEIMAHNDLAPYNVCFAGDRLVGVFDWDLAAPSTRLMELGLLAWTCVPLFRVSEPATAARRLELIASVYGGYSAAEILDAAVERVRLSGKVVREWIATDAPGAEGMIAVGEPGRTADALEEFERRRPKIEKELS
ncbi:MAG TPA: NUDIX domain-containing protein [Nocardioidaceae bacterium]|nr:NUDIX domain-containing protein [Nocardioidaceae bacterium]